ncbi:MAG: amidohydrolase family protein [Acidobacteria bacterium]|nr:amidohydrolase family protein [Acidobacteriota bacterium]
MGNRMALRLLLFAGLWALGLNLGLLAQTPTLIIEGGTLVDGTGGPPQNDAVIVIESNKIAAVTQKGRFSFPPGVRVISATGKYILPGLIDLHVHWWDWMPELFLAHGVTSVVDLSSGDWQLEQKKLLASGQLRGPRMFNAPLTLWGRLLWDTSAAEPIASAEMARNAVRKVGAGRSTYALTKAYTELTPDQLQAIVEQSHQAGRHVIAHLGSLDARQAAELGVDALTHASGVAVATIADPSKAEELRSFARLGIAVDYPLYLIYHAYMDPAKRDALIDLMVQKNVRIEPDLINTARWAAPGLQTWRSEDRRFHENPNLRYIPQNHWDRFLYDAPLQQLTDAERKLLQQGYANLQAFLRKFVAQGGTVLAGTDAASFVLPGISLHREMQLLVDAGLTPLQAIQAATKNNAEFLQESSLGTLEPGKRADLLILRQDPLADIRNTQSIDLVIQDGKEVDMSYHADFTNPLPRPPRETRFPHPKPFVRSLFPFHSNQPNRELTLTLDGGNFVDESIVEFNGVAVPTSPVKSSMVRETIFKPNYLQLTATVPAHLLPQHGSYTVVVKNPPPEGGVSTPLTFSVAQ